MNYEIDYDKLKEKGINIADRDYTKEDPQKMFCPKCKKDRKKHMNNKPLAVYWKDCYAKCFKRDRTKNVTRVHVQKVKFRHLGQPGVASFQYNTCCGRFTPMQESKTPDIPDEDPKWDNDNWLAKKQPTQKRLDI